MLGGQTRGRWNNVQENSFVLLAQNNYFDTFEEVTPNFVARPAGLEALNPVFGVTGPIPVDDSDD